MKVIFRSKDFTSVEGLGYGFNNRRPMANPWQYQGRVQHRQWSGTFECLWEGATSKTGHAPDIIWTVRGDARLFALASALKAAGFAVEVAQD
jgi:hypothetical protein